MNTSTHHKVYLTVIAVIAVSCAFAWLHEHDAKKDMERDKAVSEVKVQQDKDIVHKDDLKIKADDTTVKTATTANIQIDKDTKLKLDALQAQLNSKPDEATIKALLQQEIPKLQGVQVSKDQSGQQLISVPDTQENRDAINKQDVDFKACVFNRDDCEAKQKNLITIIAAREDTIAAQVQTIAAKDDTIKEREKTISEMSKFGKGGNFWARTGRVAIPATCGAAGAGLAAQGGLKPKGVAIAGLISAGTCAVTFHF